MLPLGKIMQKYNISLHCYADDTQLYLPLKTNDQSNIKNLMNCLEEIKGWMAQNYLQLNESKSEVVLFGPPELLFNFCLVSEQI